MLRYCVIAALFVGFVSAMPRAASAADPDIAGAMQAVGAMYGFDPDLLMAIAKVESGGDADAVSPKGAQGLMQLMPETATEFDVTDPFDPIDNLLGAARFLNYLRRQDRDPDLAQLPELLAAYNAGPGAVAKYRGIPPYPETREYVRRVLWAYLLGANPPKRPKQDTTSRQRKSRTGGDLEVLRQLGEIRHQRTLAIQNQKAEPASESH